MQGLDIHKYEMRLNRKLEQIKSSNLSKNARKRIFEFQRYCEVSGLSKARMLRYLNDLPFIAKHLKKDFEEATRKDIERVIHIIENMNYAYQTKLAFKTTLKKFYKWLSGGEEYPECVKWLKTTGKANNTKIPEDFLTEDEVKRMLSSSPYPRDRAIISVLWESGCRVGEVLSLQIKHVTFEDAFTRITVSGKTGMRRIPLVNSSSYLTEWLGNHPLKDNPEAPLWVGIGNVGRSEPMEYGAVRKMLQQTARHAGVKKKVNPHNFRHSRSTFLAKRFTESEMEQYLGWVPGSGMPATYVHLSGRDMDEAMLKLGGEKPKEEKSESSLAPLECPRCTMMNKATGRFCSRCGAVLDVETAIRMQDEMKEIDDKFSKVLEDKEVQRLLARKIKQLGLK